MQVRWRLFRESCCPYEGNYVKDLLALGRPLATTIIVRTRAARCCRLHCAVIRPVFALLLQPLCAVVELMALSCSCHSPGDRVTFWGV